MRLESLLVEGGLVHGEIGEQGVLTLMFEPGTSEHGSKDAEIPLRKSSGTSASQTSPQKGHIFNHNFGDDFSPQFSVSVLKIFIKIVLKIVRTWFLRFRRGFSAFLPPGLTYVFASGRHLFSQFLGVILHHFRGAKNSFENRRGSGGCSGEK